MPKKLKKAPPSPRPDYGLSGGHTPRISTNCKDGALLAREGTEPVELEPPVTFECDFEAVQVRLRKFENGKMTDGGLYTGGAPDDGFGICIVAPLFSSEPRSELGGKPLGLRSYESQAFSAREAFNALDRQVSAELVNHPDEVAEIELTAFESVSMGSGRKAMRPTWKLRGWRPRRQEFIEYAKEQAIGITTTGNDPNDSTGI